MAKTKKKGSSGPIKIGHVDELAASFALPDFDSFEERNRSAIDEAGDAAYEATLANEKRYGNSTEEAEEEAADARFEAEDAATSELFNSWRNAVEAAVGKALAYIGLDLEDKKGVYYAIPQTSWADTVDKIVDVINGVGMFEFSSSREFLNSGPYTPRQAVISHYAYAAKMYSKVYGTNGIEHSYRMYFR